MEYSGLIIFVVFFISVFSFFSIAPWVPTKSGDYGRVNRVLKLKVGEKFLEIGCGIGGVSLFIAKKNPESFITGIELSPFFYMISKIRIFFSGLKNINIIYGNALKLDFEKYDIVYVFGLPKTIVNKIFPKIKGIKNKNFRFISYCFQMKNTYFQEKKYKQEGRLAIYEYKNPQIRKL